MYIRPREKVSYQRIVLLSLLVMIFAPTLTAQNLLNQPESVEYDAIAERYLVSNYNGREVVSVDHDGTQSLFYSGLPAPRGLAIYRDTLYVASDTGVTCHDLQTGEIIWHLNSPSWQFVNDLAFDSTGDLYLTEFMPAAEGGGVYRINRADLTYEAVALGLEHPNGLMYNHANSRLLVVSGAYATLIWAISLPDWILTVPVVPTVGALDGIVEDNVGNIYVSSWQTDAVHRYGPNLMNPPTQVSDGHTGPADIFYHHSQHTMWVPCFYEDAIESFSVTADLFAAVSGIDPVTDGGHSWSVSWIDYDDDDHQDLYVTNVFENSHLYHNNGDGTFTTVTGDAIANDYVDGISSAGCSWADSDSDGDNDAFVATYKEYAPPDNLCYTNEGTGSFSKVTEGALIGDPGMSISPAWADYDNDGDLDLYVANHESSNYLYRQDDTGFSRVTAGEIATDYAESNFAGWADYDNDGDLDLFVANAWVDAYDFLYENNGDGTFSRNMSSDIVTDAFDTHGGSWGDYDNDGDLDLYVTHVQWGFPATSVNFLYRNEGAGVFTTISGQPLVTDGAYSFGSAWGDFDNDGDLDLFVANAGLNQLYRNNGSGLFERITEGVVATDTHSSMGAAWADYDRDGDLDLFVTNGEGQSNCLYSNTGNNNTWINIRCIGTRSNVSAIGTRVRVRAVIEGSPVWQMREITSKSGRCGQSSLNVHFGLGDASIIDSLIVRWPTGQEQILTDVQTNQFLTVTEFCCGVHTGGYTGNTNCSDDGMITLSDITKLIDRVYISKQPLCCESNGNVNGSIDGNITLSDITRLIDNVYISKDSTELCI